MNNYPNTVDGRSPEEKLRAEVEALKTRVAELEAKLQRMESDWELDMAFGPERAKGDYGKFHIAAG